MLIKVLKQLTSLILAPNSIGKVHRALASVLLDMGQKGLCRDRLHHLAIASQQAKDDAFASGISAAFSLASTPNAGLTKLNFIRKLSALQFCGLKERHPQTLMRSGIGHSIQTQITGQLMAGLLQINDLQDGSLAGQLREVFLLIPEYAFRVARSRFYRLKRTKNTPEAIQKIGRTIKIRMSPSNHQYLQG